ncbi:MAG: hypothetical protein QM758_25625 [Armatimonas sp.]
MAGAALAWACAFQFPLLDKPEGLSVLLLAATGTALWSCLVRSTIGASVALIPLFTAAISIWGTRAFGTGSTWLLPPWALAISFGVCGLAWRQKPVAAATLWCVATSHLAASLLPGTFIDFSAAGHSARTLLAEHCRQ